MLRLTLVDFISMEELDIFQLGKHVWMREFSPRAYFVTSRREETLPARGFVMFENFFKISTYVYT